MAKLDEYAAQLHTAMQEIDAATTQYRAVKTVVDQLHDDSPALSNMEGVGLALHFNQSDLAIPVPLPTDKAQLTDMLESAQDFLGNAVLVAWQHAAEAAQKGAAHCQEAAQMAGSAK